MRILIALMFVFFCSPAFAWQNIEQQDPYSYARASSPTTVLNVKSAAGILHVLTVTGGTASTINIYDAPATTANLIYSFTATNALASYILDIGFASGCSVVTNGALQYTISYK